MTRLDFQVRHAFGTGFVLDAQFEAAGGVTALFGPSGSGKSTTLAIIAGILQPQLGRVQLGGRMLLDTANQINTPPESRRVGCVFQDQRLFPHLSVVDNLRYGMQRRPARVVELAKVVEILDLGNFLDRFPRSLSGGEQQRVALGRAILHGPELLLMDEPLTALDAGAKQRIVAYLERIIHEWRLPTLLVSHDQGDVRRLAEQIVILNAGRVVGAGPTAAALDEALVSGRLPWAAPINVVRIERLRTAGGGTEGELGSQPFRLPQRPGDGRTSTQVSFLPSDVTLSRHPIEGISIRNQLRGTVREIVLRGELALVRIDVGQTVWAEVTAEAVSELGLAAGCEVTCLIKTAAVQTGQ